MRLSLETMAKQNMWPTPRSTDGSHGGRVTLRKSKEGGNLIEAVSARMWPTPTANRRDGLQSHGVNAIGGSLNPTWVEWLMGWPLEWSGLEPLETGKFRQWLRSHGVSCQEVNE
jgi:hypothetical protein